MKLELLKDSSLSVVIDDGNIINDVRWVTEKFHRDATQIGVELVCCERADASFIRYPDKKNQRTGLLREYAIYFRGK